MAAVIGPVRSSQQRRHATQSAQWYKLVTCAEVPPPGMRQAFSHMRSCDDALELCYLDQHAGPDELRMARSVLLDRSQKTPQEFSAFLIPSINGCVTLFHRRISLPRL